MTATQGQFVEVPAEARRTTSAQAEMTKPALTKIIATIGPASSSSDVARKLIEAGVSIFRLNFGHGTLQDQALRCKTIREVSQSLGRAIAIMGDVQGPKIRIGMVPDSGIAVASGQSVIFERGDSIASNLAKPVRFTSNYARLIDDVQPGERLLINDGAVRMLVVARRSNEIECIVTTGGTITSRKGINLPDSTLRTGSLDEEDWQHVEWAMSHQLDFLALSFVRSAKDVIELREGMMKRSATSSVCPIKTIAKIELPQAVQNIEAILEAADGIMVARGDLGVEMDTARVPVIQKQLLQAAESYGKPCIVATQMLESMIKSPGPTRAEASDVAGAIMEGADAVMLSGETAVGDYPVVAVDTMRRIAEYTEQYLAQQPQKPTPPRKLMESRYRTAALAHGAWHISHDIGAKFIVVWSQQGGGARYLSQNGFCIPIIAITSDDRAARQMQLLRGVTPVRMPIPEGLSHFTMMVDAYLLETGWASIGDPCVLIAGAPIGTQGVTNALAIHMIGNSADGFARHGG